MITYKKNIVEVTKFPQLAGQTDVVFAIKWRLVGSDEDGCTAMTQYISNFSYVEGQPFTPYGELTPEQVESWLEPTVSEDVIAADKQNIEAAIAIQQATKHLPGPTMYDRAELDIHPELFLVAPETPDNSTPA